jgi:hypothetical protein
VVTIYADTQNLGIEPIEAVEGDLIRWDLRRSYRRPGQGEESNDEVFLAAETAPFDRSIEM